MLIPSRLILSLEMSVRNKPLTFETFRQLRWLFFPWKLCIFMPSRFYDIHSLEMFVRNKPSTIETFRQISCLFFPWKLSMFVPSRLIHSLKMSIRNKPSTFQTFNISTFHPFFEDVSIT